MKPFKFQQFSVNQSSSVFRVGTDGVLLGVLADVSNVENILEVGTGTGLIALMLAQRNHFAKITAIDINEDAVKLASENFDNAPFSDRLNAVQLDYKLFESKEKFDFIVSNPPYFDENSSEKDVLARQKIELNFLDLIKKSSELITGTGIFSIIIPFEKAAEFEIICNEFEMRLIRKVNIYGIKNSKPKRAVLEFSKTEKPLFESHFVIEKEPRVFSDEYLELTKEFHVFGK